MGIIASNNKTHTAESMQENTLTTKEHVSESKDGTSSIKDW